MICWICGSGVPESEGKEHAICRSNLDALPQFVAALPQFFEVADEYGAVRVTAADLRGLLRLLRRDQDSREVIPTDEL